MKEIISGNLKDIGCFSFEDNMGNIILLDEKTSEKIVIEKKNNAKGTFVDIRGATTTLGINISLFGDSAKIVLGHSSFNKAVINCGGNSSVVFGDDCMSSNVFIMQPDQHHIFNLNNHKRINKGKNITVGNHVWLGREVMLLGQTVRKPAMK